MELLNIEPPFGIPHKDKPCYLTWLSEYYAKSVVHQNGELSQTDVEDIQQEIQILVWKNWKYFKPEKAGPQTFIAMVARRAISRFFSRAKLNEQFETLTDAAGRLGLDPGSEDMDDAFARSGTLMRDDVLEPEFELLEDDPDDIGAEDIRDRYQDRRTRDRLKNRRRVEKRLATDHGSTA